MVYILLGAGFEEIEAIAPGDILRRGGVEVRYAGIGGLDIPGGRKITVRADVSVEDVDLEDAEMVVIPGGLGGVESILGSEAALDVIRSAHERGIQLAAICAGPTVLGRLGITGGRKAVCYPGFEDQVGGDMQAGAKVVRDEGLTTSLAAGTALDFGLKLLEVLRGREAAETVRASIYYGG